jgi:hypothetical protein
MDYKCQLAVRTCRTLDTSASSLTAESFDLAFCSNALDHTAASPGESTAA